MKSEKIPAREGKTEFKIVPEAFAGQRFDQVLAQIFPEHSRSRLTSWIKEGQVLLDGEVVKPRYAVGGGEQVQLTPLIVQQVAMRPAQIALDIVFQDAHIIVINKPVGLVVHPGAGNHDGTMQNALLHFDPALAEIPRAGIVHRLDKETSGVMVVARTLEAHTALVEQLSERDVHRQYAAIVYGSMISGGTIDLPIGRHPHERLKMAVIEDGKPAITHYRVRERFRAHTLLRCQLETGRTHQIRVHLSHHRHPIVGDPLYGRGVRLPKAATPELVLALRAYKRQALHAEVLEFSHPANGKTVRYEAPWPSDMIQILDVIRRDTEEFERSNANSRDAHWQDDEGY